MKTFFVTGAAGFIGRSLCQFLIAQGHRVIGLDALITASSLEGLASLNTLSKTGQFRLVQANLLTQDYLQDLINVDLVFHLAGLPGVRPTWETESDYNKNNLKATQNLLSLCSLARVKKLVFTSSSSVYGDTHQLPLIENMSCKPISAYARSKFATEQWLKSYARSHHHQIITLRPFSVYGPGQRPDMAFRIFFEALKNDQTLPVHEPEIMKRDFTALSDVVHGLSLAGSHLLQKKAPSFYTNLNLGSGQSTSISKVLDILSQVSGKTLKIKRLNRQTNEVTSTLADLNKIQRMLNYSPHVNLKTGLHNYWQWFQSEQEEKTCLTN